VTVAVRTHDIALRHFREDRRRACPPDHAADRVSLRLWLPMVEVHGARGKALAAVKAGDVLQVGKQRRLCTPVLTLALELLGRNRQVSDGALVVTPPRPYTVAVRTYDIALLDFGVEHSCGCQHRSSGRQTERLQTGISMVEVHLVRQEGRAAVRTRPLAECSQHVRPVRDSG